MEEATLMSWLVQAGATVNRGQEVAEIESSKIANVLEAPAAGVLRRQVAMVGDTRAVGALLAVLSDATEDEAAIDTFVAEFVAHAAATPKKGVTPPAEETLVIDGLAVNFLRVPSSAPTDRAPLVLLHGLGGNLRNWLLNQYELAAHRDVYAIDLPGHGASSKQVGTGTLEVLAKGVTSFLQAQLLGSVHFVGHSLGAAVALQVALDRPDCVKSVTSVCGVGFGGCLNRAYLEGFVTAERRKDLKPIVEMLFSEPARVPRNILDELIAFKRIDGVKEALRLLIDHALSEESQVRIHKSLADARVPKLAILGRLDRILRPSALELPVRVCVIESAGHMPHLETAGELNRLIIEFIDSFG
jgi:pyruvate dehydrogenase E2 component (dihydrolipoamide acetyltransferase)